jgi:hypothetical protein
VLKKAIVVHAFSADSDFLAAADCQKLRSARGVARYAAFEQPVKLIGGCVS